MSWVLLGITWIVHLPRSAQNGVWISAPRGGSWFPPGTYTELIEMVSMAYTKEINGVGNKCLIDSDCILCVCVVYVPACAHGGQRRVLAVILCQLLPHFLETGSLTKPGWRPASHHDPPVSTLLRCLGSMPSFLYMEAGDSKSSR